MTIVDFHAHIYPEKIAPKAVHSVGDFYGVKMAAHIGTAEELLGSARDTGITNFVVHSVATSPKQVSSINRFIAEECAAHPEFIGFGTLHQDLDDFDAALDELQALGLHGVKLHPDTQKFELDSPVMMPVYAEIARRGLPMIFHTGDYRYDWSHPRRMRHVLDEIPDLVVDAAHFGGWSIFDLALDYLKDARCYVDISSSMRFLGPNRTRELIEIYGADRVLFGSDFPMWSPKSELELFSALGLTKIEEEKILHVNAEKILDMR